MTTSEDNTAEKASKQYADDLFHDGARSPLSTCAVIGFKDGWHARDAEVAVLRERVAELEAAVQGVSDLADAAEHGALRWADPLPVPEWVPRVRAVLKSPSEVLAAVRREAAAEGAASALEDVAHEWGNKTWLRVLTQSLVTRAAEIRAGGNR